jgi:4-amino-4-deoxy-L-arabinose transferase-like glycosyltransferase
MNAILGKESFTLSTYISVHRTATIFLVALLLRLTVISVVGDRIPVSTDTISRYDTIAFEMSEGKGFSYRGRPTAQAGPTYPTLLFLLYSLFGHSTMVLRSFLSLIDALGCVLFYDLARKYFGTRIGMLTSILLVLSPFSLYSVLVASSEVPFTVLHALMLLLLSSAFQAAGYRNYLLSGLVLGFGALCRATALLLPIFLIPAFRFSPVRFGTKRLQAYAIFLVAFTGIVTPWIIRNYIHFHRFVPIQTMGGVHLYYASPTDINPDTILLQAPKKHMSAVERDSFFFNVAWTNIKNNPSGFFHKMLWRLAEMWYRTDSKRLDHVLLIIDSLLLALAAAGIYLVRSRWREFVLFFVIIGYYICVHLFLVALVRYMVVVIPILFMFAMVPIDLLWTKLERARSKRTTAILTPS